MRLKTIIGASALALTIVATGCGSSKPAADVAPRRQANAFLDAADKGELAGLCVLFTEDFLKRMAPPDGNCQVAMQTLTLYTGAGPEDTLKSKKVGSVKVTADTAIVTLDDKVTQENSLPMRLELVGDTWLIDEIGDGAKISEACLDEQEQVEDAVDSFLSNNDNLPRNAQELVPGFLDQLPANHEVDEDGNVIPIGICA